MAEASRADSKTIVLRQHEEVWSQGNLAAVDEIYAANFVGHHPGMPDWVGPEGVQEAVTTVRSAFPDFVESVEDIIVAGDQVVTRFTASGTHHGMLRGLPPTGKRMVLAEMGIFCIAEGKIVEKWGSLDRLGMLQQLGMPPTMEPRTEFLYDISMELEAPQEVGATPGGNRRIFYVKGGTFAGPRLLQPTPSSVRSCLAVRRNSSHRIPDESGEDSEDIL